MPELLEKGVGRTTADVSVVTTAETVAVTSERVTPPRPGVRAFIKAYVVMTIGTGGVTLTPRIRRGTTASGTLVSEAHAVTVTAADTVVVVVEAEEVLGDLASVQYVATVVQASASANGTVLEAGIEVELLS